MLLIGFGGIYLYSQTFPTIGIINIQNFFSGSKFSLLDPPSQSLKGLVSKLTGTVMWQSRIADNPTKIDNLANIQQGEAVETGQDGSLSITFPSAAQIDIGPLSKVNMAQTIPNDLVFNQVNGEITYQKLANIPVSVRSMHILIEIIDKATINVDISKGIIKVKGGAKVAFNNSANNTRLIEIPAGKTLIFNDNNLRVVVK